MKKIWNNINNDKTNEPHKINDHKIATKYKNPLQKYQILTINDIFGIFVFFKVLTTKESKSDFFVINKKGFKSHVYS